MGCWSCAIVGGLSTQLPFGYPLASGFASSLPDDCIDVKREESYLADDDSSPRLSVDVESDDDTGVNMTLLCARLSLEGSCFLMEAIVEDDAGVVNEGGCI